MSSFVHKNLNPGHPGEEIVGRVIHHADLILPWTWNQVERVDWWIWAWRERARGGSVRELREVGELMRKRE